jgi:hypothetical protein
MKDIGEDLMKTRSNPREKTKLAVQDTRRV